MGSFIGNCLNSGVSEEYRQDILEYNGQTRLAIASRVFCNHYRFQSKCIITQIRQKKTKKQDLATLLT